MDAALQGFVYVGADPRTRAVVEWVAGMEPRGLFVRQRLVPRPDDAEPGVVWVTDVDGVAGPVDRWLSRHRRQGPTVVVGPRRPGLPEPWWRAHGAQWAAVERLPEALRAAGAAVWLPARLDDPAALDGVAAWLSKAPPAAARGAIRWAMSAFEPERAAELVGAALDGPGPHPNWAEEALSELLEQVGFQSHGLLERVANGVGTPWVRAAAVRALGARFPTVGAGPPLEALVEGPEPMASVARRAWLAWALRADRDAEARGRPERRLPRAARNPGWPPELRAEAVRLWARHGRPGPDLDEVRVWGASAPEPLRAAANELLRAEARLRRLSELHSLTPTGVTERSGEGESASTLLRCAEHGTLASARRAFVALWDAEELRAEVAEAWARRAGDDPALFERARQASGLVQRALVRGAVDGRAWSLLEEVARAADSKAEVRRIAVRALGLCPDRQRIRTRVRSWLVSSDGVLARASVELAAELGDAQALVEVAEHGKKPTTRRNALERLTEFPDRVERVARRMFADSDPSIAEAALRAATRASAGLDPQVWAMAAERGALPVVRTLEGMGLAGAEGLARGLDRQLPLEVRIPAAEALERVTKPVWRAPYAAGLAEVAEARARATGPGAAAGPEPAPASFPRAPVASGPITQGPVPWDDDAPTEAAGPAPAGRSHAPEEPDRTPRPGPDAAGPTSSGPPSAPKGRPMLSVARAQRALAAALAEPVRGYPVLFRLAESSRVPPTVRVRALRRLAADHPDRADVRRLLEAMVLSDEPGLAAAALAGAMLRRDTRVETLETVALRSPDPQLRARALRFALRRWEKDEVRPLLEGALSDPELHIREAALHGLFNSLRFVQPHQTERALINLLQAHAETRVRSSAAEALGAFGTEAAVAPLEAAQGLFVERELNAAARRAIARIRARTAPPGDPGPD